MSGSNGSVGYYKTSTVNLSERFGLTGDFYMTFVPLVWMPSEYAQRLQALSRIDVSEAGEDVLYDAVFGVFKDMILDWNLVDALTGFPLPAPAKDDSQTHISLRGMPLKLMTELVNIVQEETLDVPLASERRSGARSSAKRPAPSSRTGPPSPAL